MTADVCRVCGLGLTAGEKVCPSCGSSLQMVDWIVERWTKIFLWVVFLLSEFDIFILKKVVPTFADVFESFNATLPLPTRLVIAMSRADSLFIFPVGFGIFILFALLLARADLRRKVKLTPLVLLSSALLLVLFGFIVTLFMPMFDIKGAN